MRKEKENDINRFYLDSDADQWLREAVILLAGKRNRIPTLLALICEHEDCPQWLKSGIWDVVNDTCVDKCDYSEHWFARRLRLGEMYPEGWKDRLQEVEAAEA